jgi:predicted benzoate:H+ symporter BenE
LTTIGNSTSASTPRATQLPASWMMMLIGLALLGALAGYRKLKMTLPPDAGQAIPLA